MQVRDVWRHPGLRFRGAPASWGRGKPLRMLGRLAKPAARKCNVKNTTRVAETLRLGPLLCHEWLVKVLVLVRGVWGIYGLRVWASQDSVQTSPDSAQISQDFPGFELKNSQEFPTNCSGPKLKIPNTLSGPSSWKGCSNY